VFERKILENDDEEYYAIDDSENEGLDD